MGEGGEADKDAQTGVAQHRLLGVLLQQQREERVVQRGSGRGRERGEGEVELTTHVRGVVEEEDARHVLRLRVCRQALFHHRRQQNAAGD